MRLDRESYMLFTQDPAAFRRELIIDKHGSAVTFGECMDPWQAADFAALDPGLMRCIGRGTDDSARMRCYLERPRGHSKTSDLALTVVYALAFASRPIQGYAYAADRDQSRLLIAAVARLLVLNPTLATILQVESNRVVNVAEGHPGEGSSLVVSSSDVGSSFGILPDLIIADELTHWTDSGDALWHSLISSAAKRESCLMVVISNAGFAGSWQWGVRETARTDEAWIFSRLDGPRASWLSAKTLDEQRRMLPATAYARLWENTWSSSGGDALPPEDIAAAFKPDLKPMQGDRHERALWRYVAGCDLGVVRDSSAVVVLAVGRARTQDSGRVRLAAVRLWRPMPGRKIALQDVEDSIRALDEQYNLEACGFDPWQAEHLAQRLEADHKRRGAHRSLGRPFMRECPPTGT